MKARIINTEGDSVTILLKNGEEQLVPKEKVAFDYKIDDSIIVEKKGEDYIYSPNTKHKMSQRMKIMLFFIAGILIIAIAVVIVLFLVLPKQGDDPQLVEGQDERQELESCINSIESSPGSALYYARMINCYEENRVEESDSKIEEYKAIEERLLSLSTCLFNAERDYFISEDEKNSVAGNIERAIELVQSVNNGYRAKISCYETYGDGDYESEIAGLNQTIAENEAIIQSARSTNSINIYEIPDYSQGSDDPTSHNYNAPTPEEVVSPTYTPSCDDYHAQYYATYQQTLKELNSYYSSAITNARNSCGSFGGCPKASNLEREWSSKTSQAQSTYRNNMASVGCNPSEYVSF